MPNINTLKDLDAQRKNEETTKLNLITPILNERWGGTDNIVMEYYFTDGKIVIDNESLPQREKGKKADYILLHRKDIPLALVEAKGQNVSAESGFQQAREYAQILDIPFAYSTNGIELIELDMISGENCSMKITDFPYPEDLWNRLCKHKEITAEEAEIIDKPMHEERNGKRPRYYQRIAINKTIEAVAKGQNKVLLVMATGTGKTYTAFQIIHRFWNERKKKKILFLADRNILVDQTIKNDFKPFGNMMTKIVKRNITTEHEVFLGLYQQLISSEEEYYRQIPEDFFDLIVIDECHRGSADEDSEWRKILEYFSSATQIGMTATPKETEVVSNSSYFGEPIYTYSLKQGIEDGFLAPYRVVSIKLDIDDTGYLPEEGKLDIEGMPVERRLYEQKEFDRNIIVAERRETVAKRISDYLKESGNRFAKTIVFCERTEHAGEMQRLLENENSDLVAENSKYVVRITGDDDIGKAELDNFIDPKSKYPVIAVTSRLMGTGVDAVTCENIILDKSVGSMTEFKQIIGRGTRIKEEYKFYKEENIHSKMFFNIIDFRKNYLKFKDPDFDGEPTAIIDGGEPAPPNTQNPEPPENEPEGDEKKGPIRINNVPVEIIGEYIVFLNPDGTTVRENIRTCTKNNILNYFKTAEDFKAEWLSSDNKKVIADNLLLEGGIKKWIKEQLGFLPDDYDSILYLGFDEEPMTKEQRSELAVSNIAAKSEEVQIQKNIDAQIVKYNEEQIRAIKALLKVYILGDIYRLKDVAVLRLPMIEDEGYTMLGFIKLFGEKEDYLKLVSDLEKGLYKDSMSA
ncbi:MAG: EcoAI/FtnUII family type I restriction enzme subunit R [Anaerovoracaceae bacterium]